MSFNPDIESAVTLVGISPSGLPAEWLRDAVDILGKSGGRNIRTSWLAEQEAGDIFCTELSVDDLRACLKDFLQDKPLDVIIQLSANRRKKLLLADMESTIIEQEMLDEMADVIGCRDEVAAITHRAMNGEIDFAGALYARVALLKGQPVSILDRVASRITLMPGAEELLATMKRQNAACWLVSGGFTYFAGPVAAKLGFDRVHANTLVVHDGLLTGEVEQPIVDKNAKKHLLDRACHELGISLAETLAVGDGANDIPMLDACNAGEGLGVAYRAKPNVRTAIVNQINYGNLKTLAYVQGVRA